MYNVNTSMFYVLQTLFTFMVKERVRFNELVNNLSYVSLFAHFHHFCIKLPYHCFMYVVLVEWIVITKKTIYLYITFSCMSFY